MNKIPKERKEAVLAKLTGPDRKSVEQLAKEEGISAPTLYAWRKQARQQGRLMPDQDDSPQGWSAQDKFNAVIETAGLNEAELSQYCRSKGLYREQIERWRQACAQANDWDRTQNLVLARQQREDRHRIQELEKELRRKEKALAETAALLVLTKKAEAIWGAKDE
jgi:transposase-like protein